jgi:hypothetical protein
MNRLKQVKLKNTRVAQGRRSESMAGGNYYCVRPVNVYNEQALTTSSVTNRPLNGRSSPINEKTSAIRLLLAGGRFRYQVSIQSQE